MISCLNCINSGCCRHYIVTLTKDQYYDSPNIVKENCITSREKLLKKSPSMAFLPEHELENMFNNIYAEIKKSDDGHCVFLNKNNMLCSIYEERPQVCKDYKTDRCDKIRVIEL